MSQLKRAITSGLTCLFLPDPVRTPACSTTWWWWWWWWWWTTANPYAIAEMQMNQR